MNDASRNERFRAAGHEALFNLMRDAVYLMEVPSTPEARQRPFVDVNDAACKMLDYSREELLGLCLADIEEPDVEVGPEDVLAPLLAGKCAVFERRHRRRDGRRIPVEVVADSFELDGERLVISSVRDITDSRRLRYERERERTLLGRIIEMAPVGVIWVNREGQITLANQEAQECLRLASNELQGREYDALQSESTDFEGHPFPRDQLPFFRVQRTLAPVRDIRHAIGSEGERLLLSTNAVPLFDANGEFDGMVATVDNVTERVRAENALENSELYLRNVINAIQEGISVLDRDFVITRTNRTMDRWYPHSLPLVGKKCYEAYHGASKPCDPCPSRRALESGHSESGTVPLSGPQGTTGWLDLHAFPLRDAQGRVAGIVEYVRDVTSQRYAQQLLRLQRDLAATLSTVVDLDEAIQVLLNVIVGVPDIDVATLALRRPDGSSQVVATRGLDSVLGSDYLSLPAEHPVVVALNRSESVYLDASAFEPTRRSEADGALASLRAVGIVPVTHEGRVIASLAVASCSQSELDPSVRNALETIASQVGGALGRIRAQTELRRYAETQAVLLREVNHRVKNNLAAIISILHKEQDRAETSVREAYPALLQEMVARVGSLATVHRLLSESQWQPLALDELCRCVTDAVARAHKSPERVKVDVQSSDVTVESDLAHHVALVVNELVTNSLKYGWGGRDRLMIRVCMGREGHERWMRIADDGPGFPPAVLRDGVAGGLGLELVRGIVVRTLRGRLELKNDRGATVHVWFRRTPNERVP